MNEHLPLWSLGILPPALCDSATEEFLTVEPRDAAMGINSEVHSHQQRNTTIRFADPGHWFGFIMRGFGEQANRLCNWGYSIDAHEAVQHAQYGPSQHYDWHVDVFPLAGLSTDRKVTVVCLLSDPSEFTGGELQIRLYSDYTAPLVKGSIIAFPSILHHRVTPVTSGLRSTATMWLDGPRFR